MCVSVSGNGRFVAAVSRDPYRQLSCLLVFHGGTLEPYMRIETEVEAFTRWGVGVECGVKAGCTHVVASRRRSRSGVFRLDVRRIHL